MEEVHLELVVVVEMVEVKVLDARGVLTVEGAREAAAKEEVVTAVVPEAVMPPTLCSERKRVRPAVQPIGVRL